MTALPTISFASLASQPQSGTEIYFVPEGDGLPSALAEADATSGGAVSKAIETAFFNKKRKSILEILAPHGLKAARLLIVGLGDGKTLNPREWMDIGGAVRGKLHAKIKAVDAMFAGIGELTEEAPLSFAAGFALRGYAFKKYKTKAARDGDNGNGDQENGGGEAAEAAALNVYSQWGKTLDRAFQRQLAVCEAVYFARDLVNEPANILTPPAFTERLKELEEEGLKAEVLDQKQLKSLGMNALLSVGQGSEQPSSVVILRWEGKGGKQAKKGGNLVFVGKGVCFDSGGISLKPGQGMEDMKGDMAGAAAVAGAMLALARRKAPVRAAGIVGLVENMPSGRASRPGDIVTSASGQTIEILNTDAEGRLVLADLIWYAQQHLEPRSVVTLATLTGAIMVALGKENAGLFSNDDTLAAQLTQAGLDTAETLWRLPLSKKYNKLLDSKNADMKNIGGRDAGSITAAQFLQRFVNAGMPWAHLDIAGTAMGSPSSDINHSWGAGFGVRLLDRFAEKFEI